MSLGKILIRADASTEIGTGHVMRCLALAQAWQDVGGEAIFVMAETTPAVVARLGAEGFGIASLPAAVGTVEDSRETGEIAVVQNAKWIALDGYRFGSDYCRQIQAAGPKLLWIDDTAEVDCSPDILLNQNIHARKSLYQDHVRQVLLGPKYALLRREFRISTNHRRHIPDLARRVLITMGGSDPRNLTARVLGALRLLGSTVETTVVVGGSNPRLSELKALADNPSCAFDLVVNASNMPELMASADMAISAAGTTCWEMCLSGLPAIVIDTTANELRLAEELARREVVLHVPISQVTEYELGRAIEMLARSAALRSGMSQRAAELVDGQGAARVVTAMKAQEMHNPAIVASLIEEPVKR